MELQRYIRGSGLAYGAYVGCDFEAGQVTFSLYRVRLLLSDCQFNFAKTLHLYRVQTALKLLNKERLSSVVSLTVRYVIFY